MSFSYTVGGKSLTHARQRNQGQDHAKGGSNRAKNSTSSLTESSGTTGQRGGKRNSAGEQAGSDRGTGASSGSRRAASSSNTKLKAKVQDQQTSAIVTLSDLKKNQQSKPPTGAHSKPSKNSAAIPHHSGPGRKLGGHLNSDSKTSASISSGGEGVGNQTILQERPIKLENSKHIHSRTSASNLKSNQPTNVNRTPNRSTKSIDVTLNNKTSPNRQSPGRGRGSRGPSGGGMAYNSGYTSSSLYSANPRPVGQRQRRPEDDDEDPSRQRPGEAGPLQGQGSSQQQQQGESPGSYRVIQPNASKRQQLINRSSQELKAYEDYKASKKPTTIYGEAKSTGGSKSEEEARRAQEKQHQNKKYEQILKREQQRREQREREDKEFEEKKARARQTALENERRRKEREKNFLKDEHAQTNDQFLRRLEAGMCPSKSSTSDLQTPELRYLREMFPQKKPAKLQELLKITDNDVEKVIDLLMD